MWFTPLVLACALLAFACAFVALRKKFPQDPEPLVDVIDDMLPQTQCAQCGYPGCRPYAQAITDGEALNLCPPGGADLHDRLVLLMGAAEPVTAPNQPQPMVAYIDEAHCIGCTLCLPPCPVDAIIGANNKMHTVINSECTGCELCIPACPVDCITLLPAPEPKLEFMRAPRRMQGRSLDSRKSEVGKPQTDHRCINCGLCNPACPVDLPAQELLHGLQNNQISTGVEQLRGMGLENCIECGLCDRVCPSEIPLADIFAQGKIALAQARAEEVAKQRYKDRFAAHQRRQQAAQLAAADKRAARLKKTGRWS